MVRVFEYRGAAIRGKRILCTCRNLESLPQEVPEGKIWLSLDEALCVVDIPYGVEKFK